MQRHLLCLENNSRCAISHDAVLYFSPYSTSLLVPCFCSVPLRLRMFVRLLDRDDERLLGECWVGLLLPVELFLFGQLLDCSSDIVPASCSNPPSLGGDENPVGCRPLICGNVTGSRCGGNSVRFHALICVPEIADRRPASKISLPFATSFCHLLNRMFSTCSSSPFQPFATMVKQVSIK